MEEKLKFSSFVHFLEKDGIVAIFHSLSREIVFLDKKSTAKIKSELSCELPCRVEESLAYLREKEFIIPADSNESENISIIQQSILQHPCIDTLYLLLTEKCNFACTYCFFEGSYSRSKENVTNMTRKIALDSVGKFAKYLKKAYEYPDFHPHEPGIVFYGGEPFLNADVFFDAVVEVISLKKRGVFPQNLAININTNGSTINKEIASFCAKHDIEVDVSLDGYEAVHDSCRVWRGKSKGTFKDVMRGIGFLKEAGAKICISCTVSEKNVASLPEIFNWFLDGVGISNVGFNPLLNSRQYKISDPDYPQKIADAMIECFKIARTRGIYEARIMRKVRAFIDRTVYDRDCCGCGKQVVVLPDGKIGVCHAYSGTKQFFIEPDDIFDPYEHPFWKEWSKRSPINMSQCYNCEALTICGGGCPHSADLNSGSIWEVDKHFCIHAKETLRWLIWDLYEKSK